MNTIIIVAAVLIIPQLIVYALKCAKREDEQIADIQRRLEELEGKKEAEVK